ncbi:hypothetical protein E2C01_021818 [Portunus trituberculatus]|uniref:Uncharacterized protein n=1 Tax=Portunus trituberculatus TaxID=210409 RepID=A0A5B7E3S2_PORTR|nr:hypothetical protein [Portunus trituberculatus]
MGWGDEGGLAEEGYLEVGSEPFGLRDVGGISVAARDLRSTWVLRFSNSQSAPSDCRKQSQIKTNMLKMWSPGVEKMLELTQPDGSFLIQAETEAQALCQLLDLNSRPLPINPDTTLNTCFKFETEVAALCHNLDLILRAARIEAKQQGLTPTPIS